jgi:hypothetical protein
MQKNEVHVNQPRFFNTRRVLILSAILLAFSVVMLFWARDLIREVVVLPLSYLFWVFGILVKATPQLFFWISLVTISMIIAYRGLAGKKKVYLARMPVLSDDGDRGEVTGRVSYWMSKVKMAQTGSGSYFKSSFHVAVSRLLLNQLAHRYRLPVSQVEIRLKDGSIRVPDEVRAYALSSINIFDETHSSFLSQLWRLISDKLRNWWMSQRKETVQNNFVDPQLERVLQYMEEELEVSHDNPGQ